MRGSTNSPSLGFVHARTNAQVEAAVAARLEPSPASTRSQQAGPRRPQEGVGNSGAAADARGEELSPYQQQQLEWQRRQEERQARREEERAARALRQVCTWVRCHPAIPTPQWGYCIGSGFVWVGIYNL